MSHLMPNPASRRGTRVPSPNDVTSHDVTSRKVTSHNAKSDNGGGSSNGSRRLTTVAAVWALALVSGVAGVGRAWADRSRPHVVMLVAEGEYRTDETLPRFAERHLGGKYRTTFVFADPDDPNRLDGIDAVDDADVLVVSVRRRTLPEDQLGKIRDYVAGGKPVIGIRTASHAFSVRGGDVGQGRAVWPEWDAEVFGGNYTNHYGNSLDTTVTVEADAASGSPLLSGIRDRKPFASGGSLYRVSPLRAGAEVLMTGRVESKPAEPVAWTFRRADGGKSFYTSLGHVDDFAGEVLPRLLVNAIAWSLEPVATR